MNIKVNDLNVQYGEKKVLQNINFEICSGEFFVILGPNGSGKTTLLRSLSGILKPKEKTVFLEMKDLASMKSIEIAKFLAVLEPEIKPSFSYTVSEVVSFGRLSFASNSNENKGIVEKALKQANVWELREKSIFHLSSGERQRVWFAMVLAQEPKILILDEPISHLDIKYQFEIFYLIEKLVAQNITVIATIHDLNLAQYASRILLMKNGSIHALGTVQEVLTQEKIKETFGIDVYIMKNPFAIIPVYK